MSNDEKVLNTIRQIIKEVKEEIKQKKVLTEGRTPEQVFNNQTKNLKKYLYENVLKALKEAED